MCVWKVDGKQKIYLEWTKYSTSTYKHTHTHTLHYTHVHRHTHMYTHVYTDTHTLHTCTQWWTHVYTMIDTHVYTMMDTHVYTLPTTISTGQPLLNWHVTTTVNTVCSRWGGSTTTSWPTITGSLTTMTTSSTKLSLMIMSWHYCGMFSVMVPVV